jgi:hypothetical protein
MPPERESEADLRARLADAERWLVAARENLDRWEGYRDSLLRELTDLAGADSSRFVAAR